MVEPRQRPRRTLAVVLLDSVLDGFAAVRRLAGRVRAATLRDRRLLRGLAVASAVLVAGTAILLVALLTGPGETGRPQVAPATEPGMVASVEPVTPGVGVSAEASAPPPAPRESPAGPPAPPSPGSPQSAASAALLAARFAVDDKALISYGASVLISNSGSAPANGWTLVITLPRQTLSITDVVGAQATRNGATWTFVPDPSTAQVRAGAAAQVRFRVDGAPIGATPTSCTVNGRPCDGLAG
ncbi:cellulose binding domain-containing protein [Micromonospora sp. NPDC049559]|uniref:cellulose binding domain-containing protein n=1 Tax=Micromonospora sp. NPDC049559 TaxID=3155923 RepID=UPI0034443F4F